MTALGVYRGKNFIDTDFRGDKVNQTVEMNGGRRHL
jgi:hypothetical protein